MDEPADCCLSCTRAGAADLGMVRVASSSSTGQSACLGTPRRALHKSDVDRGRLLGVCDEHRVTATATGTEGTGYGLGMSVLASGLCMAPAGVGMLVVSPASAWLSMRTGPQMTLLAGLVAMTLGYLFAFAMMAAAWQIVVVSALIGAGLALSCSAMPSLIMTAVPRTETAAANGLNTPMRSLSTSSSSTLMGAVLASSTATIFVRPASGETGAPLNLSPVPSLGAFHLALAIACRRGRLYWDGLQAGNPPGIARTVRSVWRTV